jgi:hypothetical protein
MFIALIGYFYRSDAAPKPASKSQIYAKKMGGTGS